MLKASDIQRFDAVDYTIFIGLLSFSALIGIYYGFIAKRKQDNRNEYLLASRTMKLFPIAVSLIVSNVSGMTILGYPVDIYLYGTQMWVSCWTSTIAIILAVNYIYLPVFYELQNPSSFTYLECRFDKRVRLWASILYTISALFFLPVVLYIPSLALNQFTGLNVHFLSALACGICMFYTTIGGLRAVVWTDALQFVLMMGAISSVIYLGNNAVGGWANMWAAADRGHRLELFNFDPSPFQRTTFWSVFIGMTFHLLGNIGISPVLVQRCLALSSQTKARCAICICFGGMSIFFTYAMIVGLQLYAKYETCDPKKANIIEKPDQIMSLFVSEVGQSMPGLPGLFISGVLAAALSTVSSSLNTMSGTIYEDFLKPLFPKTSEKNASNIMKLIVLCLGTIVALLAIIVERLGSVFQVAVVVGGVIAGSLLGLFTLGMTSRTANSIGAIIGSLVSIIVVAIIIAGAHIFGTISKPHLPTRTDGCPAENATSQMSLFVHINETRTESNEVDDIFWLFRISFIYYSTIGFLTTMIVGYIISALTGGFHQQIDERLLTPIKRKHIK